MVVVRVVVATFLHCDDQFITHIDTLDRTNPSFDEGNTAVSVVLVPGGFAEEGYWRVQS